jgi:4-amino-4-deoxy-L-arabinose transferase-like glycosyltransferase
MSARTSSRPLTTDRSPPERSVSASAEGSLGGFGESLRPAPPLGLGHDQAGAWLRRGAVRFRALLEAHRRDLVIVGSLLLAVGLVHGINMTASPAFFDDEGTYVAQSWAVTHLGDLAPYTYWYDHPPVGWLLMAAWSLLVHPVGGSDWTIADYRSLMLVLALVNTVLLYAIARRLEISRPFAALAVVLFALSPLAVHFQRMVLLDNIAVGWMLVAFLLLLSRRGQLATYAAAGLCFAIAVLTKETFALVLPAFVLLAWQRSAGPTRPLRITMLLTCFGAVAAFYPLFATLQGELIPGSGHTSLLDGVSFQLTRPGGGGLTDPDSGTRQLIDSWLREDAFLIPVALLLVPVALPSRRLGAIGIALLLPVLVAARPSAYVPAMFVIGLLPFAALIVAGSADSLWRWGRRRSVSHRLNRLRVVGTAGIALAITGGLALAAAPQWVSGNRDQMSQDDQAAGRAAVEWIDRHVDRRSVVLVDDTVWVDLVERGFSPERTIWFYKLDLDPGVPIGREDVDYVIRSNIMEGNARDLPRVKAVLDHSTTLATFSAGPERMEVRQVVLPGSRSEYAPQRGVAQ